MNKKILNYITMLLLLSFFIACSGCSKKCPSGKANVYIKLTVLPKSDENRDIKANIYVDEKLVGSVENNSDALICLLSGKHRIKLKYGDDESERKEVDIIQEKTNYQVFHFTLTRVKIEKSKNVVEIMKKVAAWQLSHPKHKDTDWHNGPLFAGIMKLYNLTNDREYIEALEEIGDKNNWRPGNRLRSADDHCIGQTYIELYLIKKYPRMIAPIRQTFDTIMASPKKGREDWWWCDALFMAPPVLAGLATVTGEQKYLDFMNVMWWDTTNHLYDSKAHLYFRDERFFPLREKNGEKVFWSRGNGWAMAGLCRVLQYMPENYAYRAKYIALFKQMATKIAALQQNDGFWHTSLLDPDSYPRGESSGTGFFTYALTWGINRGLLSREKYVPAVQKGWNALCGAVDDSGKLGWVQQVADRPTQLKKNDSETYGTGAFLLAGCEIARLLETE